MTKKPIALKSLAKTMSRIQYHVLIITRKQTLRVF